MNFIEKLDVLMKANNLNKKTLSSKSGIAYTTIVNWYSRGYDNMTISIFKKLCDFFGVTMDSLARDDVDELEFYNPDQKNLHITKDEEYFLKCFRAADDLDRSLAMRAVKADEKGDADQEGKSAG